MFLVICIFFFFYIFYIIKSKYICIYSTVCMRVLHSNCGHFRANNGRSFSRKVTSGQITEERLFNEKILCNKFDILIDSDRVNLDLTQTPMRNLPEVIELPQVSRVRTGLWICYIFYPFFYFIYEYFSQNSHTYSLFTILLNKFRSFCVNLIFNCS